MSLFSTQAYIIETPRGRRDKLKLLKTEDEFLKSLGWDTGVLDSPFENEVFRLVQQVIDGLDGVIKKAEQEGDLSLVKYWAQKGPQLSGPVQPKEASLSVAELSERLDNRVLKVEKRGLATLEDYCHVECAMVVLDNKAKKCWADDDFWREVESQATSYSPSFREELKKVADSIAICLDLIATLPVGPMVSGMTLALRIPETTTDDPSDLDTKVTVHTMKLEPSREWHSDATDRFDDSLLPLHAETNSKIEGPFSRLFNQADTLRTFKEGSGRHRGARFPELSKRSILQHYKTHTQEMKDRLLELDTTSSGIVPTQDDEARLALNGRVTLHDLSREHLQGMIPRVEAVVESIKSLDCSFGIEWWNTRFTQPAFRAAALSASPTHMEANSVRSEDSSNGTAM